LISPFVKCLLAQIVAKSSNEVYPFVSASGKKVGAGSGGSYLD